MLAVEAHTMASMYDQMHFAIIRIVHENLYGLLVNPYGRLTKAGVKRGQRVIEVGCGPGFFTIPAANIVGEAGYVYALDINSAAVEHVRRKIAQEGLTNVEVKLADASETGLPEESVDVAFLFSVIHSVKNLNKLLTEMHRVLKTHGILSVQSRLPEKKVVETVTANGLFAFREEAKGVLVFEKERRTVHNSLEDH
jgi:ubiquinone/menaquinone biosynthesis C-methylase UbiE